MASRQQQGRQDNRTGPRNDQGRQAMHQGQDEDQGQHQNQARFDATYWQQQYQREPYYNQARNFGDYAPAYRIGSENRSRYAGMRFEDVEGDLRAEFETGRGDSRLVWDEAREAVRAAWDREDRMDVRGRDRQGGDQ